MWTRWLYRIRRDEGFAMIYALSIIAITSLVGVVAATYAISQSHFTGRDAQRVQAIPAAEAGIDLAFTNIQAATSNLTAGTTSLPCSSNGTSPALTGTLSGTGPTPATYSVTIQYYNSYPPSGTATTTCPISTSVASAVISSTGNVSTPYNVSRTMESLVQVTPVQGNAFDKALYSNNKLTTGNNFTLDGYQGDDANIYSNNDWSCTDHDTIYGSVYVQGAITAANTCSVAVDMWATGNVTTSQKSTIGHDVLSSAGNINLSSNTTVGDSAEAYGTNDCTTFTYANQCVANATVAAPPSQTFPQLTFSASAWQAGGYTIVYNNDCSNGNSGVYQTISNAATATTPEVIDTTCALSWSNNTQIVLNHNLAIISQGFTTTNNFQVNPSSTATTPLAFYLIVPYGTSCANGNGNLTTSQKFAVADTIDTFMYTPCTVSYNNLNIHYGQVYGGNTVTVGNNFTLSYVPMNVFGPPPTNAASYQVNIVYERETCPGAVGGSC